ncbi:MAG: integrase [Chloroflexi bacterium]|nr:MAG: integrase [Chloroflexota bacterium]
MKLEEAVEEFLLSCCADGLSPRTVEWHHSHLKRLVSYLDKDVAAISTHDIRDFVAHLRNRSRRYIGHPTHPPIEGGLSIATIHGCIRSLKRFFNWLEKEGIIPANPAARLRLPKLPDRVPKGISPSDFRKLLACCNGNKVQELRDRAIVLFLADTGCRAGEVCSLKVEDLNLDEGIALVRGKGRKERMVAMSQTTCEALKAYLEVRPKGKGEQVFIGQRGPLTVSGLSQVMRRLKKKAGVSGCCNPHSFRHGFAREWLMSGGDMASLSDLLGHADIETTKVYSVFRMMELKAKHNQHSPVMHMLVEEESGS